ncbi:MAG: dihydrolipoamide acetyltransferase family protein [Planctomycetota bacterium]|nr:dihydrolipoamide acetyltransferase family protein [Planctomycetota bacterium]MDA1105751.1 dihydrolipoamide acetyltransferase family protein [Planctomycetota bacterium]
MPSTITMPRLSDTMEAGTVIKWHVKEGDPVTSGSVVADIETDKATMEMQCFDDGVLSKILVEPGKQVPVGTPIAVVALDDDDEGEGEDQGASPSAAPAPAAAVASAPSAAAPSQSPVSVPASAAYAASPAPVADADRMRVSPIARRLADELGVDLKRLQGSGPGGRIIKRDIEEAAAEGGVSVASIPSAAAAPKSSTAITPIVSRPRTDLALNPEGREVAVSGMRQTIARRLVESKQQIPHYQVAMSVDCDALMELRGMLNTQLEPQGVKLSLNDFVVRACAIAMGRHPFFNASWAGDRIVIHGAVNIGIAVSIPAERGGGLVVAVLRDADRRGLRELSEESKSLAEKARTKGLSMEDMSDATFTISNLGMYGVDDFTAIINPPNSAILAVGAAIQQPVVRNGQLAVGTEMKLTLSLDHRVIDGAMAAQFLQTVKQTLENPATLLV